VSRGDFAGAPAFGPAGAFPRTDGQLTAAIDFVLKC
jgi:hypothetical protein